MIIEGSIAVKAAISNGKRKVNKVYIDASKKTKDFNYIRWLTKDRNIELIESSKDELLDIAKGKTFGGILAECDSRINDELDDLDVFYLDGIEDPFNLGYIMRNLYAFGINNVILAPRDYSLMEEQLLKSSAGAYDMMNVKVSDNPLDDLKKLKEKGYELCALKRGDDALDIFDYTFKEKSLFMLGGEKRGISSSLMELCDKYLYISYGSDFRNALNACNAAAVVSTLIYKQKRK